MKSLTISRTHYIVAFVVAAVISAVTVAYMCNRLRAYLLYERAHARAGSADSVTYLADSVRADGGNSMYSMAYADGLMASLSAMEPGKKEKMKHDIGALYAKAAELDPVDFEPYLKLGWLYAQNGDEQAVTLFEHAIRLNPTGGETFFYLSKYYLMRSQWQEAAASVFSYLYFEKDSRRRIVWMQDLLEGVTMQDSPFTFAAKGRKIAYTIVSSDREVPLRGAGLPHLPVPVTAQVWATESQNIHAYLTQTSYTRCKWKEKRLGYDLYECSIDTFDDGACLDEAVFKADTGVIEKIDIMKAF